MTREILENKINKQNIMLKRWKYRKYDQTNPSTRLLDYYPDVCV